MRTRPVFPWTVTYVTAVYKHVPPDDPFNYGPISVVPIIAKILEKLIASQLNNYCEENQLLSPNQGAYCCGRSTKQILLFTAACIIATILNTWIIKNCVSYILSSTLGRQ